MGVDAQVIAMCMGNKAVGLRLAAVEIQIQPFDPQRSNPFDHVKY